MVDKFEVKEIKRNVLACLSILIAAATIEYFFEYSNAISRSGSLITCIAIIFGKRDLGKVYSQQFNSQIKEHEERRLEIDIVYSDAELNSDTPPRGSVNELKNRIEETKALARKKIQNTDIALGITGAFIWGFGDLVFLFLIPFIKSL